MTINIEPLKKKGYLKIKEDLGEQEHI